ncbi:MAG: hypothetical protein WCO65_00065 [bacterium]
MKKIILMLTALAIYCNAAQGQSLEGNNNYLSEYGNMQAKHDSIKKSEKVKLNVGFLLAPQAELNLKKTNNGFSPIAPLHFAIILGKGSTSFLGFYTVNYNLLGAGITHKFSEKIGMYVISTQSVKVSGIYTGVGITTPLKKGMADGFIEIGNQWNTGVPYFYTGLIIPYLFK